VQKVIKRDTNGDLKGSVVPTSGFQRSRSVPTRGIRKSLSFRNAKWHEMRDGITIPSIAPGHAMEGPAEAKPSAASAARNPQFKKFSTRTMRPNLTFDTCIKCTLCWLQCPDSCFDVTGSLYDANMEACCGCGVCEAVCPVKD